MNPGRFARQAGLACLLAISAASCGPQFPTLSWEGTTYEVSCATVAPAQLLEGSDFELDTGQAGKSIEGVEPDDAIAVFMTMSGCGPNEEWHALYRTNLTNDERAAIERLVERD
jgi:hypothetical protein